MHFSVPRRCGALILLGYLTAGLAAAAGTGQGPARPPLLDEAFNAFVAQQGRWAYTATHAGIGFDGKPSGETIVLVNPALPYPRQFTPVKINGNPPSEKQLKQWADRGESAAKHREEMAAKTPSTPQRDDDVNLWINNQQVTPELDHAVLLSEDAESVTYDVPMHKGSGSEGERFDKFQLTARVRKGQHQFDRVTIRQRSSLRVKLIAKVSETLIEIEFGSPDPRYPTVPVKITSRATIKILFGKEKTLQDVQACTEMKHVTPYDERFGVKIGPTRTIEL